MPKSPQRGAGSPPPVDDRDPKDEAPDPNASPYKGMQSLGSGDGGFPQFYKRPNDDFVTLGHDPPPDGAIVATCVEQRRLVVGVDEPANWPNSCFSGSQCGTRFA